MTVAAGKILPAGTWRAVVLAALATLGVELGLWFAARRAHAGADGAAMATLAVCLIWTIVAGAILAAGGLNGWSILLRGGTAAGASGLALLVVWLVESPGPASAMFTGISVLEICATLAAVALLVCGAVYAARSAPGKHAMAMAASTVLMLACASPVLVNGPLTNDSLDAGIRHGVATAAIRVNPFYSISVAVIDQTRTVWHQRPVMYHLTSIGEYGAPPPAKWYDAGARCLVAALALFAVGAVRRRHAYPKAG